MKSFNVFIVSALLLLISFLGVGYASLTDTLTVGADVSATWIEPNILYTSSAKVTSGPSTELIYLQGSSDPTNPAAHLFTPALSFGTAESITITLSIKNNFSVSDVTADFVFKGLYVQIDEGELVSACDEFNFSYSGIDAEVRDAENVINKEGTKIAAGNELNNITLTLTKKSTTPTTVNAKFMFKFGYASPEVVGAVTAGAALEKFEESINLTENITINGKNDTAFNHIISEMSTNGEGSWGGSYVGNVTGDDSSDSVLIEALFGETLNSIKLEGDESSKCTVMIKRKQVDGDTSTGYTENGAQGEELVVMLTPDDISSAANRKVYQDGDFSDCDSSSSWQIVTVYVAVFTKVGDGEWVRIGDVYKGIADANNYDNGTNDPLNSFDTESWLVTEPCYDLEGKLTEKCSCEKIFGFITTRKNDTYTGDGIEEVIAAYKTTSPDDYAADLAASTATTGS